MSGTHLKRLLSVSNIVSHIFCITPGSGSQLLPQLVRSLIPLSLPEAVRIISMVCGIIPI